MKTCPNCGSKMKVDINFCTFCGSDIRNVLLDQVTQPVQPQQPQQKNQANSQTFNN